MHTASAGRSVYDRADAFDAHRLADAVLTARDALLDFQQLDGHWVGELQSATNLEADYLLLHTWLGHAPDERTLPLTLTLLHAQQADGGWSAYPGGPADVSLTTKAYLALKLVGHRADEAWMRQAASVIQQSGGLSACNPQVRFWLALFGQLPYSACPAIPPELLLTPGWTGTQLTRVAGPLRALLVPLSVIAAFQPVQSLPTQYALAELRHGPSVAAQWPWLSARRIGQWWQSAYRTVQSWGWRPYRHRALVAALAWLRQHYVDSDGIWAAFAPTIWTAIALRCLGVPERSEEFAWVLAQLDHHLLDDGDRLRVQPRHTPVSDTALALLASATAGAASIVRTRAVDWLLEHEVRATGGWAGEYRNAAGADTNVTAQVLTALAVSGQAPRTPAHGPIYRALKWLLSLQNPDGGWGTFQRASETTPGWWFPFHDLGPTRDESCPATTGRVLEALGHFGWHVGQGPIDRAVQWLQRRQRKRGAWRQRTGGFYLATTWQVLTGLRTVGYDVYAPAMRQAVEWLKSVQQPGGGWGEACASVTDTLQAAIGEPTATHTAWGVLGLVAAGEGHGRAARLGVDFLLDTQDASGGWNDPGFTVGGGVRGEFVKHHLYPAYFPLLALTRVQQSQAQLPRSVQAA
jgi:squalene-hopene/tetraprenyl-beta-curcumene cyclase